MASLWFETGKPPVRAVHPLSGLDPVRNWPRPRRRRASPAWPAPPHGPRIHSRRMVTLADAGAPRSHLPPSAEPRLNPPLCNRDRRRRIGPKRPFPAQPPPSIPQAPRGRQATPQLGTATIRGGSAPKRPCPEASHHTSRRTNRESKRPAPTTLKSAKPRAEIRNPKSEIRLTPAATTSHPRTNRTGTPPR